MPSYVVKPNEDSDLYVLWSDNVEAPLCWGDREFMLAELRERSARPYEDKSDPVERLDRADRMGTSALWPSPGDPAYRWGEGFIYQQQGTLPRQRLVDLLERLQVDENTDATDLLEPFED